MIKSKNIQWLALVFALLSSTAFAQTTEAKLKKLLQGRLGNEQPVESVTKTPFGGLYEVKVGNELVYTDAEGKIVFIGHVFDTETSKDLTQAKLDELNKIKFSEADVRNEIQTAFQKFWQIVDDTNEGWCVIEDTVTTTASTSTATSSPLVL